MESELRKAIEAKSPAYIKLFPKWEKADIIYEGEDSVHEAGTKLLPRLEQQTMESYNAYVKRTRFLNAFKRTVSGLEGTVKKKEAIMDIKAIDDHESDIDSAGTTLHEYADMLLHHAIKIGVCGTLVDYSRVDKDVELTKAQVEEMNIRPKLCFYKAQDIYYPHYGVINGMKQLIMLVLHEVKTELGGDFKVTKIEQYRLLRINEEGYYEQQLYEIGENGDLIVVDVYEPKINGDRFTTIPFFLHGKFEEPPLYDLVTNNIKHYQLKSSHNHVLHYIGLPQPWRTGVDPKDKSLPLTFGPGCIWDIESDKAKIGFLELKGDSVACITDELDVIKEDMAFLGASFLASDKMINETATKTNQRNAAKTSALTDIVKNLSKTFTKALIVFSEWAGAGDSVFYKYNTDFDVEKMTAQELIARVQSWQSGAFSKQSLYKQMDDGGVELAGESFEDEEELISKQI